VVQGPRFTRSLETVYGEHGKLVGLRKSKAECNQIVADCHCVVTVMLGKGREVNVAVYVVIHSFLSVTLLMAFT